jgi:tetraacyldisaccharide-1-P 4'-kinase
VVVINGIGDTEAPDPVETEIRNLHATARIFRCRQRIRLMIPFSSWKEGEDCSDPAVCVQSAYLVTAVGNPERFQRDIRNLGIEVRGARFFADHYWLKPKDWLACIEEARNRAADAIITTEKDAIKIARPPDFPLLVSVQSTDITDAGAFEHL